jgi:hypothetical protein
MRTLAKTAFALLSISLLAVASSGDKTFQAGPPIDYAHQASEHVVIGAKPFDSFDLTKPVFGKKADLNRYGILPVLLVIENDRQETIDLEDLQVKLESEHGGSVTSLDPNQVAFISMPPKRPEMAPSRIPHSHKNPLNGPELYERAFTARVLPPGERASGFFYFQANPQPGLRLYISGIVERPSGKEMLYFEIPLTKE